MTRAVCIVALLLVAGEAHADPLADARAKLVEAAYDEAAALAEPLARDPALPAAERAEANRVYGLALFFLGRRDEADAALLVYLKLEPDAHLDPALVPPEAVVFFEEVRTRHAGEILVTRPRPPPPPPRKYYPILNLLPPFGQFQNGHPVKGWLIAAAEVAFLAVNIATYAMLRANCANDLTCDDQGTADVMRTLNQMSFALFVSTYVIGVVDGFVYANRPQPKFGVGVAPVAGSRSAVGFVTIRF
jgi:hypothetical protein